MKKVGIVYDTLQASKGHHGTHFAFTGLPGVELILADPNTADLENRMNSIGAVRHYSDYREMIQNENPDIVVACSRLPGDHFPVIKAALESGAHVLCEKPVTASLAEADVIIRMAEARGLLVGAAHLARYSPVFQTVKNLIRQGAIGRPLTFYGRGKEDERGGGEDMTVLGTHILDIGCFLFGKPESVFAEIFQNGRPLRFGDRLQTTEPIGTVAGDNVFARFRFPDEISGIFESRKGLFRNQIRMGITVAGTEGCISVRYDNERKVRLSHSPYPPEDESAYESVPVEPGLVIPGAKSLDYEHYGPRPEWYFADANRYATWDLLCAIAEKRQPVSSIYDACNVLEMIYCMYASQLSGKSIPLPLADRKHPLEEKNDN